MKNNQAVKNFFLFLLLSCCWSPSFLFIKVAVDHVLPITMANLRVAIGGILLYVILKIRKINLPKFGLAWKHFAVMAVFSCALPFALFAISEKYISSSLAAIINGTTPLFTLIIAHFFTEKDRLTKTKFVGSIIGFVGLFVLVAPFLFEENSTTFGIFAGTMAAASYGIGFVYAKENIRDFEPLIAPTAQLFLASLFLLPFSFIMENPLEIKSISLVAVSSILSLAVLGTALAFIIYYKLIEETSATYVSAVNYVLPVFGALLGIVILNESLAWNSYLGSLIILTGVIIVNGVSFELSKKSST